MISWLEAVLVRSTLPRLWLVPAQALVHTVLVGSDESAGRGIILSRLAEYERRRAEKGDLSHDVFPLWAVCCSRLVRPVRKVGRGSLM